MVVYHPYHCAPRTELQQMKSKIMVPYVNAECCITIGCKGIISPELVKPLI
jgi:hypothetical protein